ncbi:MAG: hypothetical protein ACYC3X_29115 [Pirellulaceae bacterium]
MQSDDPDVEINRVCSLLESISKQYANGSPEYLALADAALAFIAVNQHQALSQAYQRLKAAFDGELTDEIKARLRGLGIEPSDFDQYV